jgi:hypothetical protein
MGIFWDKPTGLTGWLASLGLGERRVWGGPEFGDIPWEVCLVGSAGGWLGLERPVGPLWGLGARGGSRPGILSGQGARSG